MTGQAASGANIIAFTTGRGSAFGYKLVPSIKLSTNSETYRNMTEDMDIDCGEVLTGMPIEIRAAKSSGCWSRSHRAGGRNRNSSVTATMNSCPGKSAR